MDKSPYYILDWINGKVEFLKEAELPPISMRNGELNKQGTQKN